MNGARSAEPNVRVDSERIQPSTGSVSGLLVLKILSHDQSIQFVATSVASSPPDRFSSDRHRLPMDRWSFILLDERLGACRLFILL